MPTRKEWERREKQRSGDDPASPDETADANTTPPAAGEPVPPLEPGPDTNPAHSLEPKDAYTGRPDQDITRNTGAGAGGATEWGGGNKNHPSRIAGKPPGG